MVKSIKIVHFTDIKYAVALMRRKLSLNARPDAFICKSFQRGVICGVYEPTPHLQSTKINVEGSYANEKCKSKTW